MKPFQKILVPTDFSPHADEALQVAADLCKRYAASLTLVYVYEPVSYALPEGYALYTPTQLDGMFAEFDARLASAKTAAEKAGVGRVDTKRLQGLVPGEICEFAGKGAFDLIVTGYPAGQKPKAVRFWVGSESGDGSVKAKAEEEKADQWHTHVEVPTPIPAGAKFWAEIEPAAGEKVKVSFDMKE